jgi:hypothetical protein
MESYSLCRGEFDHWIDRHQGQLWNLPLGISHVLCHVSMGSDLDLGVRGSLVQGKWWLYYRRGSNMHVPNEYPLLLVLGVFLLLDVASGQGTCEDIQKVTSDRFKSGAYSSLTTFTTLDTVFGYSYLHTHSLTLGLNLPEKLRTSYMSPLRVWLVPGGLPPKMPIPCAVPPFKIPFVVPRRIPSEVYAWEV